MKPLIPILCLKIVIFPAILLAQGPHWWYEYNVVSGDPDDDFAAGNQGQLKHMASKAYEYLYDHIPGDPEIVLADIKTMIEDWDSPGPGVDDYQAVNLGQLKNVASEFYYVLISEGFASNYPWGPEGRTNPADDYALANLGQLKQVFSFDIVYPQVVVLSGELQMNVSSQMAGGYWQWIMQFGLPEGEEGFHSTPANDGIPNLLKYAMGLEPPDVAHNASMPAPDGNYVPPGETEEYRALWFDRPVTAPFGITYHLDVSYDLSEWNEVVDPRIETSGNGLPTGYERVWIFEDIPDSQLPSPYFQRLRIVLHDPGNPGCTIHSLLALNSNMITFGMFEYIGEEIQRACFIEGNSYGLEIDEGYLFTTGVAEEWNDPATNKQYSNSSGIRDEDLEEWMVGEGFLRFEHPTNAASGVSFKFEVEFDDPLVEFGTVRVPFVFASEEYYRPDGNAEPDGIGIFLFELDSGDEIKPETRTNIALLPETETQTRAINVFNAGEVIPSPGPMQHNMIRFNPNSDYSLGLGYSGYTDRLVGKGGPVKDVKDLEITALVRQDDYQIDLPGFEDAPLGGGGVLFRGRYFNEVFHDSDRLTGYIVAFGRDEPPSPPAQDQFVLYKLENHSVENLINAQTYSMIKDYEEVNLDPTKWYHIKVEMKDDTIRAKYWEDGTNEPGSWNLEYVDPEPLTYGFIGSVHTDTYEGHATQWDTFEVKADGQYFTDFGGYGLGVSPSDWTALSGSGDFWSVEGDVSATGGRVLEHESQQEVDVKVDVLRWDPVGSVLSVGKVEAGKKYLMKIVVADAVDARWHSALFLENGGIKVEPIEPN